MINLSVSKELPDDVHPVFCWPGWKDNILTMENRLLFSRSNYDAACGSYPRLSERYTKNGPMGSYMKK